MPQTRMTNEEAVKVGTVFGFIAGVAAAGLVVSIRTDSSILWTMTIAWIVLWATFFTVAVGVSMLGARR